AHRRAERGHQRLLRGHPAPAVRERPRAAPPRRQPLLPLAAPRDPLLQAALTAMRRYLNAYLDHEIVVCTEAVNRPRNSPASLYGTLLAVGEATLTLRT